MKQLFILLAFCCSASFAQNKKTSLVLIPGIGFDASVFDDFVARSKHKYKIYVFTIPGYGNTSSPALPDSAHSSYGLQYWNGKAIEGIKELIKKENLHKPFIVGHFVQGAQLALRMAVDTPDLIGGVIAVGAPAKFISVANGKVVEYPLESTIAYIDKYTGPRWFGPMSKEAFDSGNYLPEVYSLNRKTGQDLWDMSAKVPMPVYVRYLCEFFASDITLYADRIQVPVLVLRSMFSTGVLNLDVNNYIRPQFIESWDRMAKANPKIVIRDIFNSASFIWKDQPKEFDKAVGEFVSH